MKGYPIEPASYGGNSGLINAMIRQENSSKAVNASSKIQNLKSDDSGNLAYTETLKMIQNISPDGELLLDQQVR